ncbi:MAG: hypothetical protein ABI333_07945 [bacterium]
MSVILDELEDAALQLVEVFERFEIAEGLAVHEVSGEVENALPSSLPSSLLSSLPTSLL